MPMNILSKIQRRMRHKDSGRKSKLAQDLLYFRKCVEHGFPHKPTAVAYDPELKLLAIGTKVGAIRIFGAPGVELSGKTDATITHLYFLPEQGRLISIEDSNRLSLWEINTEGNVSTLECVKTCSLEEGRTSQISVCAVSSKSDILLIGTEGGKVFVLDIPAFKLKDQCLHQDELMKDLAEDYKLNPGAVEAIAQHPTNPDQYMIGYNKGLIILWDYSESTAVNAFHASQQLESIDWHHDGTQFITAHNDGSYIIWNATANQENVNEPIKPTERATTPYGPFPCKAINKIFWKTSENEPFIILSGGMPRASYGERHTVSVIQDSDQVVFDISSRVIDFFTIDESGDQKDSPHSLIILAEEEIIVVDLSTEGWPTFQLPYIASMHSSAFTCAHHVSDVPDAIWNKIIEAGAEQVKNVSPKDWPINGGPQRAGRSSNGKDLLLTGHEDGAVRFWDASQPYTRLLYKLNTSLIFEHDDHDADANVDDDEWPPFRKVGTFDPYSDDPRLGVQKIHLCTETETLIIGGSAGQVVVLGLNQESHSVSVEQVVCNIVNDRDNFEWKGHEALKVAPMETEFAPGFQPRCVIQMFPPAACTALCAKQEWNLIAAGTAHGFTIFDYKHKKEVSSTCTLNPQELVGESHMSRSAKFKQSLRDSIRRVRSKRKPGTKSRESPKKSASAPVIASKPESKKDGIEAEAGSSHAADAASTPSDTVAETNEKKSPLTTPSHERPIERRIEARPVDDSNNSVVRTLMFADTHVLDSTVTSPSVWAGTNGGLIYIFKITFSNQNQSVKCDLCKEIKLRHRAPVISIVVLDKDGTPLDEPHSQKPVEPARSPDSTPQHSLLICSEEQIKVFSLPLLKAKMKVKITAYDGSRLRKVGLVQIRSKNDAEYLSYGILALSNLGEMSMYNIPQLGLQCKYACIRRDDVQAIASCLFTQYAEIFYLSSPSEYARYSMTAWQSVNADCLIELKAGMRPEPTDERHHETDIRENEVEVNGEPEAKSLDGAPEKKGKESGDSDDADDCKQLSLDEPEGNITVDSVKEYMSPVVDVQQNNDTTLE